MNNNKLQKNSIFSKLFSTKNDLSNVAVKSIGIDNVPVEIIGYILDFLPDLSLFAISRVNKEFKEICNIEKLKSRMNYFKKHYPIYNNDLKIAASHTSLTSIDKILESLKLGANPKVVDLRELIQKHVNASTKLDETNQHLSDLVDATILYQMISILLENGAVVQQATVEFAESVNADVKLIDLLKNAVPAVKENTTQNAKKAPPESKCRIS